MVTTDWQSDLRARGYRLTPQRQLVLEAVDKLEHSTPDDILAEVRRTAGGVNISTVYRTLELLEELGLVSHAHLGHGAPTYHLADRHHHMHLVCRDCTEVIEADLSVAEPFAESLRAAFGFDTDMKHFAIFGRCAECSAQAPQHRSGKDAEEPDGAGSARREPAPRESRRQGPARQEPVRSGSGKPDSARTDAGRSGSGKADSGRTASGRSGKAGAGSARSGSGRAPQARKRASSGGAGPS